MVIHIKDDETDRLVRELARSRGITITEAIKQAIRERLEADRLKADATKFDAVLKRLQPIFSRLDRLPRNGIRTDKTFFDEIWGEADHPSATPSRSA